MGMKSPEGFRFAVESQLLSFPGQGTAPAQQEPRHRTKDTWEVGPRCESSNSPRGPDKMGLNPSFFSFFIYYLYSIYFQKEFETDEKWDGGQYLGSSLMGFPGGTSGKEPPANAGDKRDVGSILGSGRSSGGGHGNPLQYSCLESPIGRGAWCVTVHRVTESRTQLKGSGVHARTETGLLN